MRKLAFLLLLFFSFSACKTDQIDDCYDPAIQHSNMCTMDCPGVCGCDGKTYCNECVAGWEGIAVVKNTPCDQD